MRCQHFQNPKAPRPLGRGRRNLTCIFYGKGTKLLRSGILNFGPCAVREKWPIQSWIGFILHCVKFMANKIWYGMTLTLTRGCCRTVIGAEADGATHDVRRSTTSRSAHFADVTSSSPTVDNDVESISVVNELTSSSHCADCDCASDTGSRTPTSVTSSNSASESGALYRQPLQHALLTRQQRKKRSRAAFSHAQAITSSSSSSSLTNMDEGIAYKSTSLTTLINFLILNINSNL